MGSSELPPTYKEAICSKLSSLHRQSDNQNILPINLSDLSPPNTQHQQATNSPTLPGQSDHQNILPTNSSDSSPLTLTQLQEVLRNNKGSVAGGSIALLVLFCVPSILEAISEVITAIFSGIAKIRQI